MSTKRLAEETRLLQIAMEYERSVRSQFDGIVSMDDEIEEVKAAVADAEKATGTEYMRYVVG